MTHASNAALAALALLASTQAVAQVPSHMDFAKHSEVNEVRLSPDGKYVAMAIPSADGMETQLHIVPLDGKGKVQALRFGRQQHVNSIVWSDKDQVVVARADMEPLEAQPYSLGELMSSDINGKTQETLFAYERDSGSRTGRRKDEGRAYVAKVLDNEPGMVLVEFYRWRRTINDKGATAIYKVDTRTGNRREIERNEEASNFSYDYSGTARLRQTVDDNDDPVLFYRPKPDSAWTPVPKALAGYGMSLVHVEKDDNTAYAVITDSDEPGQLYKVDLAAGTRVRLAGRDDMEIAGIMYAGHDGAPYGVRYDEGKPSITYLDPASPWAKLHAGLMKSFSGNLVSIIDHAKDDSKVLFYVWGDRNPGAYYVLDRGNNSVQLINQAMPWIAAGSLAPTTPITFTTRDGVTLHGFYTGPATQGAKPMIVMPHGGPHGPYDNWGYDRDAQFLASRGYGVLQVNYRGSGGRGRKFEESGYQQWGGKMQDDLADGVKWAIDNKVADPNRICTFGASYGGYAALMQPIRYPELYKCAIGYVGVYDLQVMKKKGDIPRAKSGKRYLERVLGSDEAELQAWSPAQNVDKVKVPVFLVQGAIDQRVPMAQFNALKDAFSDAGVKVETMVAQGEGHGFYKPENTAELYKRMEAFLAKYIGPGVK
ncbi:MAG TPA: LpqB family beta-propeller domain-containing protein [Thermomonas sp.]|nr:LpqB family beta-propeller domain-containing protein [Thermomonas sp.]